MGRIADWPQKHRFVGQVRGRGLMIGIELVKEPGHARAEGEARNRVIERAFELGLLVLGCGESTVRLMPPLVIDREQADCAVDILESLHHRIGTANEVSGTGFQVPGKSSGE